ncbi:MAG: hypothetical protein K2N05_12935 [Muribaculaceae bacterium]|nr:hypothetical protein [Muribaculaceae bacterium]
MTPEEIKQTWREAAQRISQPTLDEYERMYRNKKETALESLAKRYHRFSMLGFAMVLCSFGWMGCHLPFETEESKYIVSGVMMIYFGLCAIIDRWLYKGVCSIDCYTMTVSEVIAKAMYYRKKHLQSMVFLIPCAIAVVGLMAYSFKSEKYILYGMAAGAIVGLVIGSFQFREFMDEYRKIKE